MLSYVELFLVLPRQGQFQPDNRIIVGTGPEMSMPISEQRGSSIRELYNDLGIKVVV